MKHTPAAYFAYGSNLCLPDFDAWATQRGFPAGLLTPIGRAWLPDHRLALNYRSATHQAGALNIMVERGSVVPGVLFSVSEVGLAALDHKEGHPRSYERIERVVLDDAGREHRALTYAVVVGRRVAHTPPTAAYLARVQRGYRAFGLDPARLVPLAAGKKPSQSVPDLFVYGTLLPGESRHDILRGATRLAAQTVAGELWNLGAYPGARFVGSDPIHGERYALPDPESALAVLDRVEGFTGWLSDDALFRRVLLGGKQWSYRLDRVPEGAARIPSGSWRRRQRIPAVSTAPNLVVPPEVPSPGTEDRNPPDRQ